MKKFDFIRKYKYLCASYYDNIYQTKRYQTKLVVD